MGPEVLELGLSPEPSLAIPPACLAPGATQPVAPGKLELARPFLGSRQGLPFSELALGALLQGEAQNSSGRSGWAAAAGHPRPAAGKCP